ncbi:Dihydroorotase [bioreactor metagenome]|uniref:Dihydroorotase n=1 Tax=bioreactor metagenome TaxID=1076179 RepID=A0A644XM94_9ZZZZ|nr:dihydroorotase [Rikenellaceae bacterium]
MSSNYILIKNGTLINEGSSFLGSILIKDNIIEKISNSCDIIHNKATIIDATGKLVIPGVIDDQVHFREPGSTHKGDIESESAAAVLGGVTSYMDMPNNNPTATTIESLQYKNSIAEANSYANYSFYLGATNENLDQILKANPRETCGIKVFMGSSTGNMLVDNMNSLEKIFSKSKLLIATHCESEFIIRENLQKANDKYGEAEIPFEEHPTIRSRESCIASSKQAIELANKYQTRLHILHISTQEEIQMLENAKKENPFISGEACVHYMLLDSSMYKTMGSKMKCNPAIKEETDRLAIIKAVKEGIIEVVATDHAPHTIEEKSGSYINTPSGLPLIQHSLQLMLELSDKGFFTKEEVVERMCHAPANAFKIENRGFLREGYFADIVIIDPSKPDQQSTKTPAYKCGWSPFEGKQFSISVSDTIINGIQVVAEGRLTGIKAGKKLLFNHDSNQ